MLASHFHTRGSAAKLAEAPPPAITLGMGLVQRSLLALFLKNWVLMTGLVLPNWPAVTTDVSQLPPGSSRLLDFHQSGQTAGGYNGEDPISVSPSLSTGCLASESAAFITQGRLVCVRTRCLPPYLLPPHGYLVTLILRLKVYVEKPLWLMKHIQNHRVLKFMLQEEV